jgi:hypothetical protein
MEAAIGVPHHPPLHGLFSFELLATLGNGKKDFYSTMCLDSNQKSRPSPGWCSSQPIAYSLAGMFKDVVNKTEAGLRTNRRDKEWTKQQNIVIQGHTGIAGAQWFRQHKYCLS